MEREEIEGLVDAVSAMLAVGKPGTHVELHVEADEVEPLATALSDVLLCQPMLPAVVRQDGDGYERRRYAFLGEHVPGALTQVVLYGRSTATREEWAAFRRAELEREVAA
jgi:hypothetical protein